MSHIFDGAELNKCWVVFCRSEKKAADDAHDEAARKSGEDQKMDVKAG